MIYLYFAGGKEDILIVSLYSKLYFSTKVNREKCICCFILYPVNGFTKLKAYVNPLNKYKRIKIHKFEVSNGLTSPTCLPSVVHGQRYTRIHYRKLDSLEELFGLIMPSSNLLLFRASISIKATQIWKDGGRAHLPAAGDSFVTTPHRIFHWRKMRCKEKKLFNEMKLAHFLIVS